MPVEHASNFALVLGGYAAQIEVSHRGWKTVWLFFSELEFPVDLFGELLNAVAGSSSMPSTAGVKRREATRVALPGSTRATTVP